MGTGYEIWHVEGIKEALVWNMDNINPIYHINSIRRKKLFFTFEGMVVI